MNSLSFCSVLLITTKVVGGEKTRGHVNINEPKWLKQQKQGSGSMTQLNMRNQMNLLQEQKADSRRLAMRHIKRQGRGQCDLLSPTSLVCYAERRGFRESEEREKWRRQPYHPAPSVTPPDDTVLTCLSHSSKTQRPIWPDTCSI